MAVTAEALPATKTCKHGHPMVGNNIVRLRTSRGYAYDACRQCRRDAVARVRRRKKGEAIALLAPTPVAKTAPGFIRVPCWKLLRKPLRDRVAGILIDRDPPDPLVATVIRKAAKQPVWEGLGADFAAIALVETLIEESRTSTSARLRIERVLGYLLGARNDEARPLDHRKGDGLRSNN